MAVSQHPIMGTSVASLDVITAFIRKVNPSFNPEIARQFLTVGAKYGVRGDAAVAQSIHETNWFRFGGDVKPEQNNFAGIGATGGVPGNSFPTIKDGVTAQIQHLFAYASKDPLPAGEAVVDPRFTLVTRGIAPNWEDLAGRWAVPGYDRNKYASLQAALEAGETYGHSILKLYDDMTSSAQVPVPTVKPLIVIDAGHGGTDSGATGSGLLEKNLTLTLALQVRDRLVNEYAANVKLTRSTDVFVALSDRANLANGWGAAYFVSIHINAGGGEGFESYVYPGTSGGVTGQKRTIVHDTIVKYLSSLGAADRGKKEADFAVLRETDMPAVLLENLFIDNATDGSLLGNSGVLQNLANAIGDGVAKAMGLNPGIQPEVPAWKTEGVDWLYEKGLLTDPAWKDKLDEPLPLWAEAVILKRLYDLLSGDGTG
ncbi:N-acetylmuramoyl-L-alanine amidase [Paenibacillus chitinolyticus]|uniref:N-acetylmuramoyl-L-alanine amidase n=1 Tax=Paenibacillus chitinolyticus TaxID=79263 RepID=UPI002DB79AC8|nr:N-acetylmuramoyl-L-alanine amidase [Paenibacillus chitinolyticus]MEC0246807.1 N-acetylmuramoyl-L-alanine amidase [Paenibacillus chitinolyticus]